MHIKHTDTVLHLSFEDEPFERSNILCGQFNKRQVGNKPFKQLERDALLLPFKDKQFDVVYGSHLLQFVDHPVEIFNEIRRISKAAYIKEYSEFAEILFGWPNHQWVLDIEHDKLVIRRKNPARYHKFGPLFHTLYQDDASVHEAFKKHDSILKIAFDWYETDDIITKSEKVVVEEETLFLPDAETEAEITEDSIHEDILDEPITEEPTIVLLEDEEQTTVEVILKSSQSDHFDYERHELGTMQQLMDIS